MAMTIDEDDEKCQYGLRSHCAEAPAAGDISKFQQAVILFVIRMLLRPFPIKLPVDNSREKTSFPAVATEGCLKIAKRVVTAALGIVCPRFSYSFFLHDATTLIGPQLAILRRRHSAPPW